MRHAQLEPGLRRYAAAIHELAGLHTQAVMLDRARHVDALAHAVAGLSHSDSDIAAVVLAHTEPARAAQAVAHTGRSSGPPVIADHDATAIVLAAAVLTTLTRGGRTPTESRAVIAGANAMPALCPLLVAHGVGDITTWDTEDAQAFPLGSIAARADVVINLLGDCVGVPTAGSSFATHIGPRVITPDPVRDPLLVLPGLLRALVDTPAPAGASALPRAIGSDDQRIGRNEYQDAWHACVWALVMSTPPDRQLPTQPSRELTDRIADAAIRALHPGAQRRARRESADPQPGDQHAGTESRHAPRGDTE